MNNSKTESAEMKTIRLANMGTTKCGKTTSLAVLTDVSDIINQLAQSDDGRTKTTVEYHIVPQTEEKGILIEKIDLFEQNIMGSADGNVEEYNLQLDKFGVLKSVFDLKPLNRGQNVREYIRQQVCKLEGGFVGINQLKKLMCSETIDRFVRKLTLRVPAHQNLVLFLKEKNIDLRVRDTRGLLDIVLSKDLKSQTSKSLLELGLDNLDGVIFFCSGEYPNVIAELYEEILKSVFESIPIFLFHNKTDFMYENFTTNGQPVTSENVESMIKQIQEKTHPIFKEKTILGKSRPTFKLMEQLQIGSFENGVFSFKNTYFANETVQFLLPTCVSLDEVLTDGSTSDEFAFYQATTLISYKKTIDMILQLHDGMDKIFSANIAQNIIKHINMQLKDTLENDFSKYNNACNGYHSTRFVRPQLTYLTIDQINNDISNNEYQPLGSRGGITTQDGGKLRYATTAVVAVTARKWITHLISNIVLEEPLKDINGDFVFDNTKTTPDIQQILLRKALLDKLYKQYTDIAATIQYYLIINRDTVVEGIKNTCKENNTLYDVITEIVSLFR